MLVLILSALVALAAVEPAASLDPPRAPKEFEDCSAQYDGEADMEGVFEVSLLQRHIVLGAHKGVQREVPGDAKAEGASSVAVRDQDKVSATRPEAVLVGATDSTLPAALKDMAARLSGVYDDSRLVQRCHWTLLVAICCLALVTMVAIYKPKRSKSERIQTCNTLPIISEKNKQCEDVDFGPIENIMGLTAALKEFVQYDLNPDDCLHDGCLRSYTAREQSWRICDKCGSRWMLQKNTGAYVPIAPKPVPGPEPKPKSVPVLDSDSESEDESLAQVLAPGSSLMNTPVPAG